jgi:NADP-dependent 3-hydroxy acid dehydrogenase YdfG
MRFIGAEASSCYGQLLSRGDTMTEGLQGKVCVVTGASSGIGAATARRLSAAGASVALAGRREDRLRELADEISAEGNPAIPIATDVTVESECSALIERTRSELGRLDVLINNAGVMLLGPIQGADTTEWRRMLEVNLLGLFYCTYAALPVMRDQGSGHIVNLSSVAGRVASLGSGVYNATKWGVNGFSESLRQEAVHLNVRVTVVEPGFVTTELQDHTTNPLAKAAIEDMREKMTPLEADDIAEAIFYAVAQPPRVSVNEILVRPTEQTR